MFRLFRNYLRNTAGAVTVDWVVITAMVVPLAFGVYLIIKPLVDDSADSLGSRTVELVGSFLP